jgi:hypothetical protein
MYKVSYHITGSTQLLFKWFKNLTEATEFTNKQPIDSVIEIKYYDDVDQRKPERN